MPERGKKSTCTDGAGRLQRERVPTATGHSALEPASMYCRPTSGMLVLCAPRSAVWVFCRDGFDFNLITSISVFKGPHDEAQVVPVSQCKIWHTEGCPGYCIRRLFNNSQLQGYHPETPPHTFDHQTLSWATVRCTHAHVGNAPAWSPGHR
jgi:hypothetical protein